MKRNKHYWHKWFYRVLSPMSALHKTPSMVVYTMRRTHCRIDNVTKCCYALATRINTFLCFNYVVSSKCTSFICVYGKNGYMDCCRVFDICMPNKNINDSGDGFNNNEKFLPLLLIAMRTQNNKSLHHPLELLADNFEIAYHQKLHKKYPFFYWTFWICCFF